MVKHGSASQYGLMVHRLEIQHMKRLLISITLVSLALLLSLPAMAQRIPFAQPGADAARIVGQPGDPSKDIFGVRFVAVDGVNIPGNGRETLWLEPGSYKLTVLGTIRDPMARRITRARHDPGYNIIEVVVEAGKTYHIGMKYDRSLKRSPYSTVLYRITE